MEKDLTKVLFQHLREIIPGIPENTRRLSLVLDVDMPPMICCHTQIECVSDNLGRFAMFEIVDVTNGNSTKQH